MTASERELIEQTVNDFVDREVRPAASEADETQTFPRTSGTGWPNSI